VVQHAQQQSDAAAATLRDGMRIIGADRFASELTNRQWTRWVALDGAATWRMLETLPLTSQVVDTGSFQLYRAEWFRATGRNAWRPRSLIQRCRSLERSAAGASTGWWFHGTARARARVRRPPCCGACRARPRAGHQGCGAGRAGHARPRAARGTRGHGPG
jgi:hypothetical protein